MGRPEHTESAASRARQLRREMTISERRLWRGMKNGALGARFRRQMPIGPWIVDFAALSPRLVVEVDDTSHLYRDEEHRTRAILDQGFPILRFWNEDVAKNPDEALASIRNWVETLKQTGRPPGQR